MRHISGIVQIGLGILVLLALKDQAGKIGDSLNTILTFFFGKYGIIFPIFLMGSDVLNSLSAQSYFLTKKSVGLLF